jgi:hypothetical protein
MRSHGKCLEPLPHSVYEQYSLCSQQRVLFASTSGLAGSAQVETKVVAAEPFSGEVGVNFDFNTAGTAGYTATQPNHEHDCSLMWKER